jgi:alkanesulfonate monooxygenase SsuD/methylene tetrahydromethanopterin reductase-like flavin-dependent oxidoreductase (luciferase family)
MIEGQIGVAWQDWVRLAKLAERTGFEGLFRSDHYFRSKGVSGVGATDAWTILAALAARTERLRLGTLVSPVTFRLPGVLAREALTVDHISDGRVEIGMGAGWWEEEHTRFGIPFHDVQTRWELLEEQVPIVHGCSRRTRSRSRASIIGLTAPINCRNRSSGRGRR